MAVFRSDLVALVITATLQAGGIKQLPKKDYTLKAEAIERLYCQA